MPTSELQPVAVVTICIAAAWAAALVVMAIRDKPGKRWQPILAIVGILVAAAVGFALHKHTQVPRQLPPTWTPPITLSD